ncbi:uncharacterized protein LOC116433467 [Nomia melanderi]|uniref:uncharacterized protein LOC116433467 n=1 Tax=Nomia melanderi TaxID=2448451 RepID=UPI0013045B70|nr:uncharacterized protein LOC116433467 [Nomia melanderi]XP_031847458.1 uncharacterized protein LOC116433467 [Nomia melanderi]
MDSTRQEDRSLGGGISLPQWMKGKIDNRFDFDESTFSPPSHDDNFFYIRYPKAQNELSVSQEFRPIDKVFGEQNIDTASNVKVEQQLVPESKPRSSQEIDFSKHPLPCQPFVPTSAAGKGNEVKQTSKTLPIGNAKAKSQGIDDGFHSEPALCGKSIVLVANQIMSNKFHKTFAAEQAESQPKKGSKSLPATPLTSPAGSPDSSPKARRRTPSNRYFTGPFLLDREKYQGGWILASILGQSREIVTAKIDEEDESNVDAASSPAQPPPSRLLNRKKSISSQNLTYVGTDEKSTAEKSVYSNVFQAKPSELREMNFWSPTSM